MKHGAVFPVIAALLLFYGVASALPAQSVSLAPIPSPEAFSSLSGPTACNSGGQFFDLAGLTPTPSFLTAPNCGTCADAYCQGLHVQDTCSRPGPHGPLSGRCTWTTQCSSGIGVNCTCSAGVGGQ